MDSFFDRLLDRAATIDELLSDAYEPLPGQTSEADRAARRLAAWCRSCAGGDWSLFERRLERDGLSIGRVLAKFATVRRTSASVPSWIEDAIWIESALRNATVQVVPAASDAAPCPFEDLFAPVVHQADAMLWGAIDVPAAGNIDQSARACLSRALLSDLSDLLTPAIYERFAKTRDAGRLASDGAESHCQGATYRQFLADMKDGGFRRLFEDKPVLLRLTALIARQWIDASRELIVRLADDLPTILQELLDAAAQSRVVAIEGGLSDPHNNGRFVRILSFEDGSRIVYKPKDLRVDAAWHALIERLNAAGPPVELKAVRSVARAGYGWTEFVNHAGCTDAEAGRRFYRRAGAWLALFHCFAGTDLHQENIIAAGEHPVPIDLEMVLQTIPDVTRLQNHEEQAFEVATEVVANSVLVVGLLPAYGKAPDNNIFAFGGMTADWTTKSKLAWNEINSDAMQPTRALKTGEGVPNLPHLGGRYFKFGDYIDDFVSGFDDYARFLLQRTRDEKLGDLFDGFAGVPIRKIVRPTRFYAMLLQRLREHRNMDDGAAWSAQADFGARLINWDNADPVWPLLEAERAALLALNVPHFVMPSDGGLISDTTGVTTETGTMSGMDRARTRVRNLDKQDIAWQIEVIRQNTGQLSRGDRPSTTSLKPKMLLAAKAAAVPSKQALIAQAGTVAEHLSRHAIRRGPGAAWIGLDWPGDTEVSQLVALGPELYNGLCGIAVFLAAHAAVAKQDSSEHLMRAALVHLRKQLRGRNAARMVRSVGIGGGNGLGSIVYALTVMSNLVHDDELLADAHVAAELFTDDLIAADRQLDVLGGSAGAILGLLALHRRSRSDDVLARAIICGQHLLAQQRVGAEGIRSWSAPAAGARPLNGMSHGAAGFAYALASLAAASGREEFAQAAQECIAFENSSYDAQRGNWPDHRSGAWPCQWCHGAVGIGLARLAMMKHCAPDAKSLTADINNALAGAERSWPGRLDTLCCGTLGSIEFFCEAASTLGRSDLRELASRRLSAVLETAASTGDFRWNSGKSQFNLGLFRGLAGTGYTILRQVETSLPNVLIWE